MFKHVSKVQQVITYTYQRPLKKTAFKLIFGTKMRQNEDLQRFPACQVEMAIVSRRYKMKSKAGTKIKIIEYSWYKDGYAKGIQTLFDDIRLPN